MFDYFERKQLVGVMTATLLSPAVTSVLASSSSTDTFYLLDSQGNPIITQDGKCVQTRQTPNLPAKFFKQCGAKSDRDGDGLLDEQDICPDNTPAEISQGVYQTGPQRGCPLDSDQDGIPDYRDKCPHNTPEEIVAGVDSQGCPLDTDQDGIVDYNDLCPGTPTGVAVDEHGCALYEQPVDIVLAGDVTFAFNKSELTPQAQTTLNELVNKIEVDFLKKVTVVGHTDSVGSKQYNQALSVKRAFSVANYLVNIGLPTNKIAHWGEGEQQPIATNESAVGRAQNRRVEIKITHFKKK
jgi:OOP family OmpA-OmpF porin